MASRNGARPTTVGLDPNAELSRKGLLGRAAVLAGAAVAVGFPSSARATPPSREGVRWDAANGRFDSTFVITSPSTLADNVIRPTADVPALTLTEFAAEAGTGSALDIVSQSITSTEENYVGTYKKAFRFYSEDGVFSKADPELYVDAYGNFQTRRAFICSGNVSKATGLTSGAPIRSGGYDYQILPPTKFPGMISIWSDINGDTLQMRLSLYGETPDNRFLTCLSPGIDNRDPETGWDANALPGQPGDILDGVKYLFGIGYTAAEGARLEWGDSTSRNAYDARLYRTGVGKLETDANLRFTSNNGVYGLRSTLDEVKMLVFNDSNASFDFSFANQGFTNRFFGYHEFFNNAGTAVIFKIDGNGDITVADQTDIILNGSTGTKIGTATTQKLGFFNATPVVQRPSHGPQTAGTGYGSRERNMLNDVYTGLRTLGLIA